MKACALFWRCMIIRSQTSAYLTGTHIGNAVCLPAAEPQGDTVLAHVPEAM